MRSLFPALAFVAASVTMSACAKPEPPVITPKETRVTAIDPLGVSFVARVEATNPNKFALATQGVTARILLDNDVDLGTVTAPQAVTLPAGQTVLLDLPLAIKWADLGVVGKLALANRPMPFKIDGTVKIGGEKLNVAVPFQVTGTITKEQLAQAAIRGLPGGIPGLPGLSPR